MVARIEGFVSRSEAGLRNPRSRSTNITPANGGIAVHWGGTRQWIGSHSRCFEIWRAWQNFHMNNNGWVDIAYSFGFCNHGYVFAGRGYRTRTAANGTNSGNQNFYAAVWLGGQQDGRPTTAAFDALDWIILDARESGGAGRQVRDHHFFTGSTCGGPDLRAYTPSRHNQNVPTVKESDVSDKPSSWAEYWWERATRWGIINGKNPKEPMTREQVIHVMGEKGLLTVDKDALIALDREHRQGRFPA